MQLTLLFQALNRGDLALLDFKGQRQTSKHRHTVKQNGTRPAFTQFAAMLGTYQAHIFTQHLKQCALR
jgi:hypothetical protein